MLLLSILYNATLDKDIFNGAKIVEGDVTNFDSIEGVVCSISPDVVISCLASLQCRLSRKVKLAK